MSSSKAELNGSRKVPKINEENVVKNDEPFEDDWGIVTPAPPKKKKAADIGVKSRK